jgi:hypothetical protein
MSARKAIFVLQASGFKLRYFRATLMPAAKKGRRIFGQPVAESGRAARRSNEKVHITCAAVASLGLFLHI